MSHFLQSANVYEPTRGLNVPTGHSVGCPAPAGQKWPLGHLNRFDSIDRFGLFQGLIILISKKFKSQKCNSWWKILAEEPANPTNNNQVDIFQSVYLDHHEHNKTPKYTTHTLNHVWDYGNWKKYPLHREKALNCLLDTSDQLDMFYKLIEQVGPIKNV